MTNESETMMRLSAQRALLGTVTRGLRAVSTELEGKIIRWRCIFASPTAKESQWEELSAAATEVLADFPDDFCVDEQYLVVRLRDSVGEQVNRLEHLKHLVFLRHEEYSYSELPKS